MIKLIFAIAIAIAISLPLVGCGLIGALRTSTELTDSFVEVLPEWLTLDHRVQAAERSENDAAPIVSQPAATQPGSTQPAQQAEQQAPSTGTPRWQQPGTMEYIAKQQLDTLAFHYKRVNSDIISLEGEKVKDENKLNELKAKKKERTERYETMSEIAGSIGLSLDREYGIKPPPADANETKDSTWFNNWNDSPSGFGD